MAVELQRLVRRSKSYIPGGVVIALLAVLIIAPLGMLVYAAFSDTAPRPGQPIGSPTLTNFSALFAPGTRTALQNSLLLGLGGGTMAMVIGSGLGWLAARTDVPGRRVVQLAGIMPMFISSLVGALAWALLASPSSGYLNLLLSDLGVDFRFNIYSLTGMILVSGLYYAPFAFLFTHSAFSLMNPEFEEAARVHGASQRRIARTITFPLIRPALLGSGVLTFVLIFENFPIPTLLGSPTGTHTLPSTIYRLISSAPPRHNEAAAVGMLLMVIMIVLVYVQRRLLRRGAYATVTGKGFRPNLIRLGLWRWPAFGLVLTYLMAAVGLPAFALLQSALRSHGFIESVADLADVSVFTLRNVEAVLQYQPFQVGLQNSFLVGAAVAVVGVVLTFCLSYFAHRTELPGRRAVDYLAMAPIGMPALVIGMGFLWAWTNAPVALYGTFAILILAYVARFTPEGYRGVTSSILQLDRDLEESARVCGAGRIRTNARITLPLMRTAIVSTMLLLFILALRELSAAIFLFTADTRILSVVIFEQWESGSWARVAVISIIYSLMLLVLTVIGRRWFKLGV